MVADILQHAVELQAEVTCNVKGEKIVLEGNAAVFLPVPLQGIQHHKAEAVDEPRLQAHLWRMVLKRPPVVLHQVDGILVGQRHEVQILLPAQLVSLVEHIIAHLAVPIEILPDDVGIALAKASYNLLVRQLVMIHVHFFDAKLQKKLHTCLIFLRNLLQSNKDMSETKLLTHQLNNYSYERE